MARLVRGGQGRSFWEKKRGKPSQGKGSDLPQPKGETRQGICQVIKRRGGLREQERLEKVKKKGKHRGSSAGMKNDGSANEQRGRSGGIIDTKRAKKEKATWRGNQKKQWKKAEKKRGENKHAGKKGLYLRKTPQFILVVVSKGKIESTMG